LHFPGSTGSLVYQIGSMAAKSTQLLGFQIWKERAGKQPNGMEFMNPLAILHIRFSAFDENRKMKKKKI